MDCHSASTPRELTGVRGNNYGWDADDPVLSKAFQAAKDPFDPFRFLWLRTQQKYGDDRVQYGMSEALEDIDFSDEEQIEEHLKKGESSNWELGQMADEILRVDSKREICRRCDEKGTFDYGAPTGELESLPQADEEGNPVVDDNGDTLFVDYPELQCKRGHRWYKGEGKSRGIGGPNPILFENHLQDRRRREIYTSVGTPDPSIAQGMYNRTHPQGRKVNSKDQRKKNGASFFR